MAAVLCACVGAAREDGACAAADETFAVRVFRYTLEMRDGAVIDARAYAPAERDETVDRAPTASDAAGAPLGVAVFAHGGCFTTGDCESHASKSRSLASRGLVVVDTSFRQGAAHPHPAALRDLADVAAASRRLGAPFGAYAHKTLVVGQRGHELQMALDEDDLATVAHWRARREQDARGGAPDATGDGAAAAPVSRSPEEAGSGPPRKRDRPGAAPAAPPRGQRPKEPPFPFTDLVTVGKGTYGEVYKARPGPERRSAQGDIVALKKLVQRHDDWGFPITSLREHRILLRLRHPNLVRPASPRSFRASRAGERRSNPGAAVRPPRRQVTLHEIYTPTPCYASAVYMVFEYLELDLEILIQSPIVKSIDEARVKSVMQQLLEGVHFMHKNNVMHRDLKPSNLLVNRRGDVKICDFGLARSYKPGHAYTGTVITLNYRPPELCLGCRHYGPPVDVWSVGAIFAELLGREIAIRRGEDDYLQNVYAVCGTPSEADWPEAKRVCPKWREACAPPLAAGDPGASPARPREPYKRALADNVAQGGAGDDYFWEGDEPLPPGARALPWDVDSVRAARDDQLRSRKRGHY
ncbi:cyclin-dependent protein serine/threonine kinase [Aureococcus anophagefferens]|nr:cyclin-dependent protein serine/threonine kinase [Aureococcus anophagefferens]